MGPGTNARGEGRGRAEPPLDADALVRLVATEADLVTGAIALDRYRRKGVPAVVAAVPGEEPETLLRRVFDALRPADLRYPLRVLWKAARDAFEEGEPLSAGAMLRRVPDRSRLDCESYMGTATETGMGIAYFTPLMAERLLRYAAARDEFQRLQAESVGALEAVTDALRGPG